MKKFFILAYGAIAYVMFLGVFVYAVGFIGNIGISNSLDALPNRPFTQALFINLGLLSLFAVQHSVMARQGFKRWLTRYIPESAERSTYVLFSNLAMIVLFVYWEPMGGVLWQLKEGLAYNLMLGVYFAGWGVVLLSTFLINHYDLFGLQQIWYQWRGKDVPQSRFVTPLFYKLVRHPLYVGWIMVVWATTTMTVAHLLFAVMCSAYILVAVRFEEKDLVDAFGDQYRQYQRDVPMIFPAFKARTSSMKPSKPGV